MKKEIRLAIVGATGLVGETALHILNEKNLPISALYLLASEKSAGAQYKFKEQLITVTSLLDFDFSLADYAIFSAGSDVAKEYAPIAANAGCVVVDNSSCFRYDSDIPLIVPEVNANVLDKSIPRGIIANPNCSTIQMLVAIKPIYERFGIKRIDVATYQSVSGQGKQGINTLQKQTHVLMDEENSAKGHFEKQSAFNILPEIDCWESGDYTREEMKMVWESKKILNDDSIIVNPTAARVPVFIGHAMAVHVETKKPLSKPAVLDCLQQAPGVKVFDKEREISYATQAQAVGQNAVLVGRIREAMPGINGVNLWVVADNVRKGAALNAVQIVECLLSRYNTSS